MSARRLGALATLAFPATIVVADFFRIRAEAASVGDGSTVDSISSMLASIESRSGDFALAAWLFYAAALLTIPTVLFLWRSSVERAPRLAWAAGVLGALAVIGQIAHCMGYFAPLLAFSAGDHVAGAQAQHVLDSSVYGLAVFAPYLIGVAFFPPVAAVALRRAGVTPLWAMVAVILGSVAFAVLAGPWWVTAVWGVALIAGFWPAARAGLAGATNRYADAPTQEPAPSVR